MSGTYYLLGWVQPMVKKEGEQNVPHPLWCLRKPVSSQELSLVAPGMGCDIHMKEA